MRMAGGVWDIFAPIPGVRALPLLVPRRAPPDEPPRAALSGRPTTARAGFQRG